MRVAPSWLALREPADASARAAELVERLPAAERWIVHDLGSGTGSMGRWLAPRLAGPQHWVLHDTDADLLKLAAIEAPGVTVETRRSDVTRLAPAELAGATLITASALLDLLTGDELTRLVGVCADQGCPVLLTLSVIGRVELSPPDPLDAHVAAAFDAHQRRGRLLGPDAVAAAVERFEALGSEVLQRPSPWQLGAAEARLAEEWLRGWVGVTDAPEDYTRMRLEQLAAGQLTATVHHADLLVQPSS